MDEIEFRRVIEPIARVEVPSDSATGIVQQITYDLVDDAYQRPATDADFAYVATRQNSL